MTWTIVNAEQRAAAHEKTFKIPPSSARRSLATGDLAKLLFETDDEVMKSGPFAGATGERMWVYIKHADDSSYAGELSSKPAFMSLSLGQLIYFTHVHVLSIDRVCCVECQLTLPDFEEESEMLEEGWGQRPHTEAPQVKLWSCPPCHLKNN
ncbi:MAG: hypothetical protein ACTSX8_04055 [Alphaproteobacteria bacterium]